MIKEFFSAEAIVFAGGPGIRMGDLTKNYQKCLLLIDGKPILGHVLDALSKALGSTKVTICVSYRANDVRSYVNTNTPGGMLVDYLFDEGDSKTAVIYRSLKQRVHGPSIGSAGDIIVDPSAYKKGYERLLEGGVFASVVLSPRLDEAKTHAVGKISEGRVTEFRYPGPINLDADYLRDLNIWGINEDFYGFADRNLHIQTVSRLLQEAVTNQRYVAGTLYQERWVHVAYPEDLNKTIV